MNIVTLDIETMANKSWHWRLWQENIGVSQLIEPTYMLSYSFKVNNGACVYKAHYEPGFLDILYDVLDNADLVITYNGDKFDMLHVNREFVEARMPPPRPVPTVDLYKVVKSRFKFPSNRLDYVAGELLGERKLDTGGFDLWKSFAAGDERARRLMARYNKRDVRITHKLYKHLRAWVKNHPFLGQPDRKIDDDGYKYECPVCAAKTSSAYIRNNQRRTRCYVVRQVCCRKCGHWYDGKREKI
jgi:DNA polymerase elongation subunit (family B)